MTSNFVRTCAAICVVLVIYNSIELFIKSSTSCIMEDESSASRVLPPSPPLTVLHDGRQLPPPPHPKAMAPRSASSSMAACLLIKDDNDIINEWIAYHYHALALRYMIVAIDPTSETSPKPIFEKWRTLTDMEIVEWGDEDFMPQNTSDYSSLLKKSNWTETVLGLDNNTTMFHAGNENVEEVRQDIVHIRSYIYRQNVFLSSCLREMKKRQRRWLILLDTDEYIVMSKELRKANDKPVFMTMPDFTTPGSLFDSIMEFTWWSRKRINYPCIPMPSLKYGGVENTGNEPAFPFPRGYDERKFETLRWTHHISEKDDERNGPQKVIIDIAEIPDEDQMFGHIVQSVHRPSLKLCQDTKNFFDFGLYPFTLNHYLGSWERFSGRKSDPRRKSRARYDYLNDDGNVAGQDTWLQPWVDGFVKTMGVERASLLLEDYLKTSTSST